jgi:hypothetical protein
MRPDRRPESENAVAECESGDQDKQMTAVDHQGSNAHLP